MLLVRGRLIDALEKVGAGTVKQLGGGVRLKAKIGRDILNRLCVQVASLDDFSLALRQLGNAVREGLEALVVGCAGFLTSNCDGIDHFVVEM